MSTRLTQRDPAAAPVRATRIFSGPSAIAFGEPGPSMTPCPKPTWCWNTTPTADRVVPDARFVGGAVRLRPGETRRTTLP
ncbi:hypothetical protein [Allokutzneria albata]|uniref:Uncharacterized protein n=1 Tax=Allokutzneria albata TaxID=211114 RepID=A0A1G9SDW1_ALLAB|nr:hypothetical protein [Allokutzneria albata]SDM33629.1 hypothetical protein SAMN04489726_1099 [Allokutzneria albata]